MITDAGISALKSTVDMGDFQDVACDLLGAEHYMQFVSIGDIGKADVIAEAERLKLAQDEDGSDFVQCELFKDAAAQCHA